MNPRNFKTPLAAARGYAAENTDKAIRIEVRYVRWHTGNVSQTRYYAVHGKVEPDRGYFDHRNGHCPICGKVYLETVVRQSWTRPEGNLFAVACKACADKYGWDQAWRPGVPVPDPHVMYKPEPYILIDMVHGQIEIKES